MISGDAFGRGETVIFAPLRDALLAHSDHYMHLADLKSYLEADQAACALYRGREEWARKAVLNVPALASSRATGRSRNTRRRAGRRNLVRWRRSDYRHRTQESCRARGSE
jgi:glucan phosphorylase